MGENELVPMRLDPDVVLGGSRQFRRSPSDIVVRMAVHPEMVERRVIGGKVEHQSQAALSQTLPQSASAASPPSSAPTV
jgi:hypothetical protein